MNADDYIVRAGEFNSKNDFDNAIADLAEAIKLTPNIEPDKLDDFVFAVIRESEKPLCDQSSMAAIRNNKKAEIFYIELLVFVRDLAEMDPEKKLPMLAHSFSFLATMQHKNGSHKEAENNFTEAVKIQRRLIERTLAKLKPNLPELSEDNFELWIDQFSANLDFITHLSAAAKTLDKLAELQKGTKRYIEAEASHTEALGIYRKLAETRAYPYLSHVALTLFYLANLQKITNRDTEAEANYTEALGIWWQLVKTNDGYLSLMAITLDNLAELQAEADRYTEAAANYAESLEIKRKLAEINPDEYLETMTETKKNLSTVYLKRGDVNFQNENYNWALADFSEAIRLNPDYVMAYGKRKSLYNQMGNCDGAIGDLTELIRIVSPLGGSPPYAFRGLEYDNKSEEYRAAGDENNFLKYIDLAIEDYTEAIRLDPTNVAYYIRGIAYGKKGQHDLAIEDYTEAIRLDPNDSHSYDSRGLAYYKRKQYDLAIKDFSEVIRLNPDDSSCYNWRGIAHHDQKQYDLAIRDFSEAIRLDPDNSYYYRNRSLVYYDQNQYDLASKDDAESSRLNPITHAHGNCGAGDENDEFVKGIASIIQRVSRTSKKAWEKGLLALEGEIDEGKLRQRDVFEYGMRLIVDGMGFEYTDRLLSNLIAHEQNENVLRIKEMQKEAVLSILSGENPKTTMLNISSRINVGEFKVLRRLFPDTDILLNVPLPNTTTNNILAGRNDEAMEGKEFAEQAAYTIRKTYNFSEKSRREGLLALEGILGSLDDDFMKNGFRLVVGGVDRIVIDRVLSNTINLEHSKNRRRLKIMQKAAVLCIQAGENTRVLLHRLMSYINNSELEALWKTLPDIGISEEFSFKNAELLDKEENNFMERLAYVVRRAMDLSLKSRREGLLVLEDTIDMDKVRQRDIFEYGMQFVVDGTDCEIIDDILSNIIAHEQDKKNQKLKHLQKVAVFCIQNGENTRILLHRLISYIDNSELEALRKALLPDTDVLEELGYMSVEPLDEEGKDFSKRLAHVVRRAMDFSQKARREGMLALGSDIDMGKVRQRDIFEYGMQFVTEGVWSQTIDDILSNIIAHERGDKKQKLKQMQKAAVLGIQAGENTRILSCRLVSHMDNSELEASWEAFQGTGILEGLYYEGVEPIHEEEDFIERLAHIVQRAYQFSQKARRKGLLAMEDEIDAEKVKQRDIFEYGIRFAIDGTDAEIINEILSDLIDLERDEKARKLKIIQKEAVLGIQRGDYFSVSLHSFMSYIDNSEFESLQKALLNTNIFKGFHHGDIEAIDGNMIDSEVIVPKKIFYMLKEQLEKIIDRKGTIEIINGLTSNLQFKLFDFIQTCALLLAYLDPAKGSIIQKHLPLAIQDDVAHRTAAVDCTSPEVLSEVERILEKKLPLSTQSKDLTIADNVEIIIEILKITDRVSENLIIEDFEDEYPELAEEIKKRRFVFGDIVFMPDREIQKVMREVRLQEFSWVLKNAEVEVQEKIFKNISKRAATMLKEEMESMISIRPQDIEKSQQEIISIIRHLEETGEIVIGKYDNIYVTGEFSKVLKTSLEKFLGRNQAIDIINNLASTLMKDENPRLAEEIRNRTFVFEDIVTLDDISIQKAIRKVDSWELAIALQDKIFKNMSKRTVTMLREDMEYIGPLRLKDIDIAKQKIISIIQYLEDRGEVVITRLKNGTNEAANPAQPVLSKAEIDALLNA